MPVGSSSRPQSAAQIRASIDDRFDRLARMARQIGGSRRPAPLVAAMLAGIDAAHRATLACARREIIARIAARGRHPPDLLHWCAACAEPGFGAVCAYCGGAAAPFPGSARRAA